MLIGVPYACDTRGNTPAIKLSQVFLEQRETCSCHSLTTHPVFSLSCPSAVDTVQRQLVDHSIGAVVSIQGLQPRPRLYLDPGQHQHHENEEVEASARQAGGVGANASVD